MKCIFKFKKRECMKTIDVVAAILLVVGGLNWGLVGLFNFDVVSWIFGTQSIISRLVFDLVGLAAIFQAVQWKAIQQRWKGE
jgi:uncharacterized membrane protein YuzA (DUF378 family)